MITWAAAVKMPLPQACTTLPIIITAKLPPKILSSSPAIKQEIPDIYSFFVGNRVIKKAVSGITIPIAREYPLVTHCPIDVVTPKYSTKSGSAVVIAVASEDDATPDTTRLIKINARFLSVSCTT